MTTYSAIATVPGCAPAQDMAEAMERMVPEPTGVGVFEVEDGSGLWEVGAYFLEKPDMASLALLEIAFSGNPFVVSEVPDVDWVAAVKRDLAPVEAGRFFVYGSHDADKVPTGREPLLIEAAMAFGTGHHGTTLGCLRAFDRLLDAGAVFHNTLDIGCGTAVLGMAAARVFPEVVLVSDIDEVAVDVAKVNVTANGLDGQVVCVEAAGFDHQDLAASAPFDLIFANILKGPLVALAPSVAANCAEGGTVILSGLLNTQAEVIIDVYERNGFNLTNRDEIVDWTTLTLTKKR